MARRRRRRQRPTLFLFAAAASTPAVRGRRKPYAAAAQAPPRRIPCQGVHQGQTATAGKKGSISSLPESLHWGSILTAPQGCKLRP